LVTNRNGTAHKRVGLALSGGVARGPAHVGALLALERAGIPIDVVSGTSAGALVGALYCAGIAPARMVELITHFGWRQIARLVFPRQGFVSFDKLEQWLARMLGDPTFQSLQKPLAVVATDLESGEPVTLCSGPVARAVHASCAVPGFVVPVRWNDQTLCDGGASCNLPTAQARALGADFIIGVDLFRHAIRGGWGPFGVGIGALENLVRRSGGGLAGADCLITPAFEGELYLSFGKAKQFVELGERAADAMLPAIRAALAREDSADYSLAGAIA
jgi:NTE family protein